MHETVVAWVRCYFRKHPFQKSGTLDENVDSFKAMLKDCERHLNTFAVSDLCHAWPRRIKRILDAKGDRVRP